MKKPVLFLLALVVCSQIATGYTTRDAAGDATGSSVSREKRESYDKRRLIRSLKMLRLGKRDQDSSIDIEDDLHDSANERIRSSSTNAVGSGTPMLRYEPAAGDDERTVDTDTWDLPQDLVHGYVGLDLPFNTPLSSQAVGTYQLNPGQSSSDVEGMGYIEDLNLGKRQLPMLRLGKRRSLDMLRLGKRLENDYSPNDKGSLGMLPLSKRNLGMLRLGKREEEDKRSLGMLRLGKREEEDKRSLGMLRLGKREEEDKRSLGMLRLGKREEEDKRSLAMLRLGKRGEDHSRSLRMLRLGKREEDDKRSLAMLRLGKRSTQ